MIDLPLYWLQIGEIVLAIFPLIMIYCLYKDIQHDFEDDREE